MPEAPSIKFAFKVRDLNRMGLSVAAIARSMSVGEAAEMAARRASARRPRWPHVECDSKVAHMIADDLRPRPFCANDKLTVAYADSGKLRFVKCNECGAMGPLTT